MHFVRYLYTRKHQLIISHDTCACAEGFLQASSLCTSEVHAWHSKSYLSRSALTQSLLEDSSPSANIFFDCLLYWPHIAWAHRVHITYQPSPPFPVHDVVMVPGLLPIFFHGCEIKSGSGLGTRLGIVA